MANPDAPTPGALPPAAPVPGNAAAAAETKSARGPDLLDRTWDFFASVPVATVMLFIVAAASVAGTLIEQEGTYSSWLPPAEYYPQRYGPVMGPLLMRLGLTHAYTSWWFLTLLAMVGTSLLVCSLQRGVPLYRAIHFPPVAPVSGFLRHLKYRLSVPAGAEPLAATTAALRKLGYGVSRQGDRMLAEKGRWNRWGPYTLHLGLLLILLGALARAVPGWYTESTVWIKDGEIVRVPGADWFVRSEKFSAEFYPDGRPKLYATEAVLLDGGVEKRHTIKINEPLEYKGVHLYQSSYNTTLGTVEIIVRAAADDGEGKELGRFTMDMHQPEKEYRAGDLTLQLADYFPDFGLDERGKPATRSGNPVNPAVQFKVPNYDKPLWFFVQFPDMVFDPKQPYHFTAGVMAPRNSTGLRVKTDRGLPAIWAGLFVISLGTILTFYLSHRRIWAMVENDRVLLAGQTNRDKMGFAREMRRLAAALPGSEIEQLGG